MAKKQADDWDYEGVITSVNVKGRGPATSHQFLFTLDAKGREPKPFRLDWSNDPVRYQAMASLVLAAFEIRAKVKLRVVKEQVDIGEPYAGELEIVQKR